MLLLEDVRENFQFFERKHRDRSPTIIVRHFTEDGGFPVAATSDCFPEMGLRNQIKWKSDRFSRSVNPEDN